MLPIIRHFSYSRTYSNVEKMNLMNGNLKIVGCSQSQVNQDEAPVMSIMLARDKACIRTIIISPHQALRIYIDFHIFNAEKGKKF